VTSAHTRCIYRASEFKQKRLITREGVTALPYAEILNPIGEYFAEAAARADAAVRPYADILHIHDSQ
jgi:hypothetical protein